MNVFDSGGLVTGFVLSITLWVSKGRIRNTAYFIQRGHRLTHPRWSLKSQAKSLYCELVSCILWDEYTWWIGNARLMQYPSLTELIWGFKIILYSYLLGRDTIIFQIDKTTVTNVFFLILNFPPLYLYLLFCKL